MSPVVGAEPSAALLQDRPIGCLGGVEPAAGEVELGSGDPGPERVGVPVALRLRRDDVIEDRLGAVEPHGIRQESGLSFEAVRS